MTRLLLLPLLCWAIPGQARISSPQTSNREHDETWTSATSQTFDLEHERLNFSSPGPHIFAATFGLLQQWPNTFVPYGHSIVPCEVPINTNLYHARIDSDLPPSPEWFAFDASMSYAIAGNRNTSHLLTYRTTRTVKCIYFDGTSAALNGEGNMDSQMVLIHKSSANVPDDPVFGPPRTPSNRTSGDPNGGMLGAEYDRAEGLCAFIRDNNLGGRGWGYEGIVRMNAAFEMIWCDFESPSAKLVTRMASSAPSYEDYADEGEVGQSTLEHMDPRFADLESQFLLSAPGRQPGSRPRFRMPHFAGSSMIGWLADSVNQYGFVGEPGRGEVRIKADSCNLWTFYDPGLLHQERRRVTEEIKTLNLSSSGTWTSPENETEREMALTHLQRRRRALRANHVSEMDGIYLREAVLQRLRSSLDGKTGCSGIDWHLIAEEVVLQFSSDLQMLVKLLRSAPASLGSDFFVARKWLIPVRSLTHLKMMPYYEYPPYLNIEASPEAAFSLAAPKSQAAYNRCRDQYLPLNSAKFTEAEKLIFSSTVEVLGVVCHVLLTTFLSIETAWYASYEKPSQEGAGLKLGKTAKASLRQVEELMAWLGWADQWTACNPGCGPEEMCIIPMWPLSFMPGVSEESRENAIETSSEEPPSRPPYGGPQRPGYDYGGRRPPRFGRDDDKRLWEPSCVNRTRLLLNMADWE